MIGTNYCAFVAKNILKKCIAGLNFKNYNDFSQQSQQNSEDNHFGFKNVAT